MTQRPKEGIYLEAALAIVGEQLEERIDELSRRRRLRGRLGVAALSVVAVASGSFATAVALSAAPTASPAPPALSVQHELRCMDGDDARDDAYFTLRYRTADGESGADGVVLCGLARSVLDTRPGDVLSATPEELIEIAEDLVDEALADQEPHDEPAVAVTDAAFHRASGAPLPVMIACTRNNVTFVMQFASRPQTLTDEATACTRAGS